MAPHLKSEVIAAIETAVEYNEGVLESALIHSLAKIYKTSPQAIVWNMNRYNKVKAGCDDRQNTGRHAVMDKDAAAEYTKQLLVETPGLRMEKITEKLHDNFGVHVSTSWISRLIRRYRVVYEEPKPPKVKKVRIPKPPKPSKVPKVQKQAPMVLGQDQLSPAVTLQYPLPPPGHYPSFRQDLQQAIQAPPSTSSSSGSESERIPDVFYGILKSTSSLPPPAPPHPHYPLRYQYSPSIYPPLPRNPLPPAAPLTEARQALNPPATSSGTVWKVLNVVELG